MQFVRIDRTGTSTPPPALFLAVDTNETIITLHRCVCISALDGPLVAYYSLERDEIKIHIIHAHTFMLTFRLQNEKITHNQLNFLYSLLLPLPLQLHFNVNGVVWMCVSCVCFFTFRWFFGMHTHARTHTHTHVNLNTTHCTTIFVVFVDVVAKARPKKGSFRTKKWLIGMGKVQHTSTTRHRLPFDWRGPQTKLGSVWWSCNCIYRWFVSINTESGIGLGNIGMRWSVGMDGATGFVWKKYNISTGIDSSSPSKAIVWHYETKQIYFPAPLADCPLVSSSSPRRQPWNQLPSVAGALHAKYVYTIHMERRAAGTGYPVSH